MNSHKNGSMKSFEIELLQKNPNKGRRQSIQQEESEWDKFLNDSRQNLAAVADPQSCEGWRFLRPPNVGNLAAGLEEITDEKQLEETTNKVWIPDPTEGYVEAQIVREENDEKTRVNCDLKELTVAKKDLQEMNPACFNYCEDMARLTHLNEASILYNLRQRGESGAGKTENTKKILQYFAAIASKTPAKCKKTSLEKQILETNPVLESFGNAKTLHNDNSSRFGKFIRVNFDARGKVSGAEIESYLLEKCRVIGQSPRERSFHIFYQLISNGVPELKESLKLSGKSADYRFIAESTPEIQGIDDAIEMNRTDRALSTLGFTNDEKLSLYQMTAAVLLMGEMKFFQRSVGDQAYPSGVQESAAVCHLLGVNLHKFLDCLTEPTVTVGEEVIKRGQNLEQVLYSVSAIAKAVYEKTFRWLVKRCNKSISVRSSEVTKENLDIGVLDIAGFEIFTLNSFEQLCINYTNEKLQQFFNHHMFIREQEEYKKENIIWDYIDYGMDLQPTIELIDKPLGIFSILEEECIMPKGSDKGFADKLHVHHLGKSPQFGKPKLSKKSGMLGDFSILHYAGLVNYNVEGWIDKNKDPLNECVIRLFQNADNILFGDIWRKYGPTITANKEKSRRRGSFSFLTVSTVYRDQLNNLMNCLNKTKPHFIRCIIPNYQKKPGIIDGSLVLFQLRCNGVLEGIRICRQGYPNRMLYEEFKNRYRILDSKNVSLYTDPRDGTEMICKASGLKAFDDYQLGKTKIKPLMEAPVEELKQEVQDLKNHKEVLEEKLTSQENENVNLKKDVSRLENDVEQIIENSKAQEYELDLMKKEMDRQETLMSNMHNNITKQTDDIDQLKSVLEKEQDSVKDLRCTNAELEDEVSELGNNFNKEKKMREELEEINNRSGQQLLDLQRQLQQIQQSKKNLQAVVCSRDEKTEYLTSKVKDQKEKIRSLQEQIKELQAKIDELEAQLFQEKAARRRAEKLNADLEDDVSDLKLKMTKFQKNYDDLKSVSLAKDKEIEKLKKQMLTEAELKEEALEDLRKRHASSSLQYQQQIEHLHKRSLKLESENQQLKGQIDHDSWASDPSRFRSLSRRRHSITTEPLNYQSKHHDHPMSISCYTSYSKSSSTSNILVRRIEELEKEVKQLKTEKRMMKRELDVYKKTLEEETAAKEAFSKEVRACLDEIESLNHRLLDEEEKKDHLGRQLAKSHSQVWEWKAICEEKLIDRDTELSEEKKKLRQKLADLSDEHAAITAQLHAVERYNTEHLEEIREKEMELERAQATISSLEKRQKTHEKALDQWDTTVKEMAYEIEGLKEENSKLRTELRHYKRDHHEFDEYSDLGNLTDSGRESVDEDTVLKKLEVALSAKVELEEQLKQKENGVAHVDPDVPRNDEIRILQTENQRLISEKENLNEEIHRLHQICHELNVFYTGTSLQEKSSTHSDDDPSSSISDVDTEITVKKRKKNQNRKIFF